MPWRGPTTKGTTTTSSVSSSAQSSQQMYYCRTCMIGCAGPQVPSPVFSDWCVVFSRLHCYTVWLAIGIILSSVCLSVMLCIAALGVDVGGYNLYHHVSRMALPIHFFEWLCYTMYRPATKQRMAKKLTGIKSRLQFELSVSKYSYTERWPLLLKPTVCSYTACYMQYDRLSWQELSFLFTNTVQSLRWSDVW